MQDEDERTTGKQLLAREEQKNQQEEDYELSQSKQSNGNEKRILEMDKIKKQFQGGGRRASGVGADLEAIRRNQSTRVSGGG